MAKGCGEGDDLSCGRVSALITLYELDDPYIFLLFAILTLISSNPSVSSPSACSYV
jgi:hypothetical protein